MQSQVGYFDLGASLYTPCTNRNLPRVLQDGFPLLRSLIVCLEDSIKDSDLILGANNLKTSLKELTSSSTIKRFIRPRNPLNLSEIMAYDDIDKIDGFVLPKFDLDNIEEYRKIIFRNGSSSFFLCQLWKLRRFLIL
jgi:citrate lyase beta subunit